MLPLRLVRCPVVTARRRGRCSKRHPKCIKKLFCNETCEQMAHKKKEDSNAAPKPDAKKAEVKKKKSKGKKENHGYVRATIAYKDYE